MLARLFWLEIMLVWRARFQLSALLRAAEGRLLTIASSCAVATPKPVAVATANAIADQRVWRVLLMLSTLFCNKKADFIEKSQGRN